MDIKYAYYNTSKGYRVLGGTAVHFLKADGSLDGTEYIDKTSFQDIIGTKRFYTSGGNNYDNNSLHIASSDGSDPAITFNKIGTIAGQIKFKEDGYHFLNPNSGYRQIKSAAFIRDGYDDNWILLAGGGSKKISDFALSSQLVNYVPYTGATQDVNLNQKDLVNIKLNQAQRFNWTGSTSTQMGKVTTESAFYNLGVWGNNVEFGYGISTNSGGGLDIMANQGGQSIRFWAGTDNSNPYYVGFFNNEQVYFNPIINTASHGSSLQWLTAYNKQITNFNKNSGSYGDYYRLDRQDGTLLEALTYGMGIVDIRNTANGLDSDGAPTYFPLSTNDNLSNKLTPIFHVSGSFGGDWASSIVVKGWSANYTAWKLTGKAGANDTESDLFLSSSKQDGTWFPDRKIWTDKNLSNPATLIDLNNYVTLNTSQEVPGRKAFSGGTANVYSELPLETRGNGSSIYPGIGFHQPGSYAGTISLRNSNQFYFRNTDDSDFNYLLAKGFAKYGSDDDHFLTGNGGHYPKSGKDDAWLHSGRDFTQGTRILTNIDYSQWSGAAFLVEIKGNMYGGGMVMDCKIQGYIYNDTIINAVGYSTHPLLTEIIALNLNGELCFWFPRLSYWQGFSVKVTDVTSAGVTTTTNRAYQIADATDPGGIKRVRIPIVTVATQNWVNDQSFVTTNTVQAITALKEFYTTLAMANGQSIYLKGSSDTAHYIRHFSDDTDGFGVSSGFAVKNYSTLENLFQVTSTGFGEFKQNVRAGGFLKAGSSNNFVLLGYGDHKPLSDFWTSANFNPATKVNAWENAYALGFSSGISTAAPYIYHATDGYVFLATQSWVSSNFANQIQLNVEFTTNLGTGLMLSDDHIGGESGLIDIHQKAFIAGKFGEYYKYGSSIDGLEGINYDLGKKNIGIGGDIDSNKVRVEGCVKAIGNFKSEEEKPDTMFIPDGQIATLRDEIVNEKYAIRLNPHEYGIDAYSTLDVDDRNRLIHIVVDQVDMRVNFNKIYPKQQIVIYNFDQKGNGLEVQINGKTIYYIEQHCFLRLYVTDSLRVIAERQQPCDFVW